MPCRRKWTDEELIAAVASSTTYKMVLRAVGLTPMGGNHYNVKHRIEELGLDTSHFVSMGGDPNKSWSDEHLRAAVASSSTLGSASSASTVLISGEPDGAVGRPVRRGPVFRSTRS